MSRILNTKALAFALGGAMLAATPTMAVTLDFEGVSGGLNVDLGGGFIAEDIRIVNGNCASGSCAALNTNGPVGSRLPVTTIRQDDNSAFTLTSFWFQRLGVPSEVTVTTSAGVFETFDASNSMNNSGTSINTAGNALFENITFISFDNSGTGNIRIDDIVALDPMTPVPLPAAGWMLLAGVGGIAAMKRRKKA